MKSLSYFLNHGVITPKRIQARSPTQRMINKDLRAAGGARWAALTMQKVINVRNKYPGGSRVVWRKKKYVVADRRTPQTVVTSRHKPKQGATHEDI